MRRALVLTALVVSACGAKPRTPRPAQEAHMTMHVDARDAPAVRVEARFVSGGSSAITLPSETIRGLTSFEVLREGKWTHLDPTKLDAPECAADCSLRYAIDLEQVERSFEGVVDVGNDAFVAPSPSWLAHPDPMPHGTFDIDIDGAAEAPSGAFVSVPFATGLRRRDASHFFLPTHDYYEGSFAAFGHVRHRLVDVAGAKIEIALVSDTKLALTDDEVAEWVEEDAAIVSRIYGHYPVSRATVFVVPIDGADRVVFGKVLSLGGASIIALVGTRFTAKQRREDWVLVHEMTHLGFPTMGGVRWLTEGLATYYEPILRTRAGWRTPEALWTFFAREMKRGMPPPGSELALDKREGIDAAYWGGALFMLMADVAIRTATSNKKSFDDVLRAVVARGGDATVVWTMSELLEAARKETGTNALGEMVERCAVHGERIDIDARMRELGVREGEKTLDDTAPLAAIRRSIESGH